MVLESAARIRPSKHEDAIAGIFLHPHQRGMGPFHVALGGIRNEAPLHLPRPPRQAQ